MPKTKRTVSLRRRCMYSHAILRASIIAADRHWHNGGDHGFLAAPAARRARAYTLQKALASVAANSGARPRRLSSLSMYVPSYEEKARGLTDPGICPATSLASKPAASVTGGLTSGRSAAHYRFAHERGGSHDFHEAQSYRCRHHCRDSRWRCHRTAIRSTGGSHDWASPAPAGKHHTLAATLDTVQWGWLDPQENPS